MRGTDTIALEELFHVGPGTLGGGYWRRFWHPIYRLADLAPGCAIPVTVLGEQLTLYRGQSGECYLAGFRCAHRGSQEAGP